ncbi:MAG: DUF2127 domain-containing protein [Candidatus Acidiferrales bacterium]
MRRFDKAEVREVLFRVSILLKGLNAVLEIAGGIALLFISPRLIAHWIELLTRGEFAEGRRDFVSNYLHHAATHISPGSQHFVVAYLLAHGIVKLFLVIALLKNKLWGYPAAIVVFSGFIGYQVYLLALYGGSGLVALTIFDVIVIFLIWFEYRAVKVHAEY